MVTLWLRPKGTPMASTKSPGCVWEESPSGKVGRPVAFTLSTAISVLGSLPTTRRLEFPLVAQLDFDIAGALDYVLVGEDVTVGTNDDTGAEAFFAFAVRERGSEELAEGRILLVFAAGAAHDLGRGYVDHGGQAALDHGSESGLEVQTAGEVAGGRHGEERQGQNRGQQKHVQSHVSPLWVEWRGPGELPGPLPALLSQRHIQVSSRRYGPSLIDVELSRQGLRRQVFLRSQHNHAACMVVSATDMLLTLPQSHAQLLNNGLEKTNLKYRVYPCPLPAPHLEAHLYWHESVENDPGKPLGPEEIVVLAPKSQAPVSLGKRRGSPRRHPQVC